MTIKVPFVGRFVNNLIGRFSNVLSTWRSFCANMDIGEFIRFLLLLEKILVQNKVALANKVKRKRLASKIKKLGKLKSGLKKVSYFAKKVGSAGKKTIKIAKKTKSMVKKIKSKGFIGHKVSVKGKSFKGGLKSGLMQKKQTLVKFKQQAIGAKISKQAYQKSQMQKSYSIGG